MKRISTAMLTVLLAMVWITACSTNVHQEGEDKSTTKGLENIQEEKNSNQSEDIVVECAILQNTSETHKETDFYYSDPDENQQVVGVSISANCDLMSFKIIELGFDDENGEVKFYSKNTLYTVDTLPANTDFILNTVFLGIFPSRGISFLDADNVEHVYALTTSGEDGSAILFEITD